jgi:N-acetylglutamate synthase-like GNAT family acetyltransferase
MFTWVEIIGYAGSLLVAVSLMMSSLVRLRWINLGGALAFAVYGWLVGAYPVLAVNGFIVLVNVYYLWKMSRGRDYFSLMTIRRLDNRYLQTFLEFHARDIARFFPDFALEEREDLEVTFILRNVNPAGLVISRREDAEVRILLDYVLPQYRDLRCARFFLEKMAPVWRRQGIRRLLSPAAGATHREYLKRLGFNRVRRTEGPLFERSLD